MKPVKEKEDAVSPIIGVILMVAITVLLAAVIGAYVFGSPTNVTKSKSVAATAQTDTMGNILITYQGGQNDDKLISLSVISPDGNKWYLSDPDGTLAASGTAKPNIGTVMTLIAQPGWPSPGQRHVVVVGIFTDQENQAILDTIL